MPEPNYKIGTVVQLTSGGPKMTISKINNNRVTCQWFVGNELKSGEFDLEVLMMIRPSDESPIAFD